MSPQLSGLKAVGFEDYGDRETEDTSWEIFLAKISLQLAKQTNKDIRRAITSSPGEMLLCKG